MSDSEAMNPDELGLVLKHVMKLLVERRFNELEEASGGMGLSADDIEGAVDDIGSRLAMPPETVWRDLRARAVRNQPGAFEVTMELWNARGRTPHTVEVTVQERNGKPMVVIDDVIVG
ncbi:MAG: hypothetical protein IPM46_13105 [Flavobacteriales bacterium]|nr:hypothetical protein [Flavobacteriales bacterium]